MKSSEKYLGTGFIFKLFSSFICGLIIFMLAGSFSILLTRPIICLAILGLTFPMFVAKRYIKELKSSEALSLILRSLAFIVFIVKVAQDRA